MQRKIKHALAVLSIAAATLFTAPQAIAVSPHKASKTCLSDCTTRMGIVSAFGAEADILVAETTRRKTYLVNGNRFTTGVLRGNPVVIVLSGVSLVNSVMVTQLMLDHFKIERLLMSGIAGGLNPDLHVGDVTIPDRWVLPMEVYWSHDSGLPKACGKPGDLSCLGLKLATRKDGAVIPAFNLPAPDGKGQVSTGLFMRENFVMTTANAPQGEFVFAYPVDPAMLAVASQIKPKLAQCGPGLDKLVSQQAAPAPSPLDPKRCVRQQPKLVVGGAGATASVFLANAAYRKYLFDELQANTFEMETAGLAHVAYANKVPYLAIRSLSDLAGEQEMNADVAALFSSGLAEANEAATALAFLEAWKARKTQNAGNKKR